MDAVPQVRERLDEERARLRALAASQQDAFDSIVDGSADVATDDEHDPEGHTIAFERQQQAALLQQTLAQIAEVDAAIERDRAGEYGACEGCGESIADERLEVMPATRHCLRCAAA